MKRFALVLLVSFLSSTVNLLSQQAASGGEEKLISVDSAPATFYQTDPRLYVSPSGGFWVSWWDTRDGLASQYMQRFDKTGKGYETNLKALPHENLGIGSNGSYLALHTTEIDYNFGTLEYTEYFLDGRIVRPGIDTTKSFGLDFYRSSHGTISGSLGHSRHVLTHKDYFRILIKNEFLLKTAKVDLKANKLSSVEDLDVYAEHLSPAMGNYGNYVLFYNKPGYNSYVPDSSRIYMAKFFSSEDSLLSEEKKVLEIPSSVPVYVNGFGEAFSTAVSIQDSLYQFVVIDTTSKQLHYSSYSQNGELIAKDQVVNLSFPVQTAPGEKLDMTGMRTSNLTASGYSIILTARYIPISGNAKDIISQYNFNEKGILTGEPVHATLNASDKLPFSDGIYRDEQGAIYTVAEKDNDIYLDKYLNLQFIQSSRINDDAIGGNQIRPVVVKADNEKDFVVYEDENGLLGRYVDKNGNAVSQVYKPLGKAIEFFSDGRALTTWEHKNPNGSASLGYAITDKDFNILKNDSLEYYGNAADASMLPVVFSDNSFVIAYQAGNKCKLSLYDKSGIFVKSKSFDFQGSARFGLFRESGSSFSVKTGTKTQMFSSNLDSLHVFYKSEYAWYLRNGIFAYEIYPSNTVLYKVLEVKSELNPSLQGTITIGWKLSNDDISFVVFNEEAAGVFYRTPDKYYIQAFSLNDLKTNGETAIYSDRHGDKKDMSAAAINGNSALFAWADSRTKGEGYSIYARQFTLDELTEVKDGPENETAVPSEFSLSQNYPNPFNPVTTIEYSLPEESNVSLVVYDVLGREVKAIARGVESAGSHSISFDASGISSGVYIYTLQAGGGRMMSRKMVVMK